MTRQAAIVYIPVVIPALLLTGVVFLWIAIYFQQKMIQDVKRLAPSKATGLRNLYETALDNGRVRREHKRLLPKSKTRSRMKTFVVLALVAWLLGILLSAL